MCHLILPEVAATTPGSSAFHCCYVTIIVLSPSCRRIFEMCMLIDVRQSLHLEWYIQCINTPLAVCTEVTLVFRASTGFIAFFFPPSQY